MLTPYAQNDASFEDQAAAVASPEIGAGDSLGGPSVCAGAEAACGEVTMANGSYAQKVIFLAEQFNAAADERMTLDDVQFEQLLGAFVNIIKMVRTTPKEGAPH